MNKILNLIGVVLIGILSYFIAGCVSGPMHESTGEYIDSASITGKVKAQLVQALGLSSMTHIQVTTYKGVVQLSGFINNRQDVGRAIAAVKQVPGVVAVENSLIVKTH